MIAPREPEAKSWSHTFNKAGVYVYRCEHSKYPCGKGGKVIVVDVIEVAALVTKQRQAGKIIPLRPLNQPQQP